MNLLYILTNSEYYIGLARSRHLARRRTGERGGGAFYCCCCDCRRFEIEDERNMGITVYTLHSTLDDVHHAGDGATDNKLSR